MCELQLVQSLGSWLIKERILNLYGISRNIRGPCNRGTGQTLAFLCVLMYAHILFTSIYASPNTAADLEAGYTV